MTTSRTEPADILRRFGITKKLVARAIAHRLERPFVNGLCYTFSRVERANAFDYYQDIPVVLRALGGRSGRNDYFWLVDRSCARFRPWPVSLAAKEAEAARQTMLAFMYTWADE